MMHNNLNLDLVSVCAYAKFAPIQSLCSPDIEQKWNSDNQGPELYFKFANTDM